MDFELENAYLQFNLDPVTSTWNLSAQGINQPSVSDVSMRVRYRRRRWRQQTLHDWSSAQISDLESATTPHGQTQLRHVLLGPDANGLSCRLTFALPQGRSLLLWRITLENQGAQAIMIDRIDLFRLGPRTGDLDLSGGTRRTGTSTPADLAFFSNGWQSWSYCGAYGTGERFRRTRLGPLRVPVEANSGTPRPSRPGHFASDMFGVLGDRQLRTGVLLGMLSQRQHFCSLEARLNTRQPTFNLWANGDSALLPPGAQIETDWACLSFLNLDESSPLAPYLDSVAREHGLDPSQTRQLGSEDIPTGWCSWYQFSSETSIGTVTAGDVQRNLEALRDLQPDIPLKIIQIDDGFEARVGDWSTFTPGFPQGVVPLAGQIQQEGFVPGIWLAPFIVSRRSRLAQSHPEWLLRGRFKSSANAGYFWDGFATALDLTHPEALAYTKQVVDTAANKWGFPYLKLDFLYAGALPGKRHDPTRTRAQALRDGLQALREAAGEKATLLGCACPLGSGIGLVDTMRISADSGRGWFPSYNNIEWIVRHETTFSSARNAIHNTLTRAPLHRRWWVNDPDCLLLRKDTRLTLAEVRSVATAIALSGGSLLLSDDLPALSEERLQIAHVLLPLIGKAPWVVDWFDAASPSKVRLDLANASGKWHLLALFNWDDVPRDLMLDLRDFKIDSDNLTSRLYYGRSFWGIESAYIQGSFNETLPLVGGVLPLKNIPPHGVVLVAVRRVQTDRPCYMGSNLHISQGLEVAGWEASADSLELLLERPGRASGHLELSLPGDPKTAYLDEQPLSWKTHHSHIHQFSVDFFQSARLRIQW